MESSDQEKRFVEHKSRSQKVTLSLVKDENTPAQREKNQPSMRGMCLTPWLRAYEVTLSPAEIERLDKRLEAAFEADKNYRLEQASRRPRTGKSKDHG